jgi:hypothetical protein
VPKLRKTSRTICARALGSGHHGFAAHGIGNPVDALFADEGGVHDQRYGFDWVSGTDAVKRCTAGPGANSAVVMPT